MARASADYGMIATKPARRTARRSPTATVPRTTRPARAVRKPLESGQNWRMGEDVLRVEMVGKLLVHYKLIRAKAVRTPTSISSITTLQKYIRKNKAVLDQKRP